MDLARGLEVARQIILRVAPPARPVDIHLAAPQSVAQRDQHAQLIRDALDPAAFVDHRLKPRLGHHAVDRDGVLLGVEADLAVHAGVADQQLQRLHHRPVGGVVAAELQRRQQRRQHPPIVIRVRRAQHSAHTSLEHLLVGLGLTHQIPQRLLPDHRKQRLTNDVVGMVDRGLGQLEQDALLASHPPQVVDHFFLDLAVGAGVDLVDQLDQQIHQRAGDLRGPHPAQRRQQRQPHRLLGIAQIRRERTRRPCPPSVNQLLAGIGEQVSRQLEPAHGRELVDLPQQGLQTDLARIGLQLRQQAPAADARPGTGRGRRQLVQRRLRVAGQVSRDATAELLLESRSRRADDAVQAARPLDPVGSAPHQHRFAKLLLAQLDRAHLLGQPSGQPVLVGAGGLAESERFPDLRPVILDRAARQPVLGTWRTRSDRPSPCSAT